mgnify:CR=1 FL=1
MTGYLARRVLAAIPLLIGVLTLVFLLLEMVPGDPFGGEPEAGRSREASLRLRQVMGVDRPIAARYLDWLRGFLTGDLGVSLLFRRSVLELLVEGAANTLILSGTALLLQFLLGTAAGIATVWDESRRTDRIMTPLASLIYSVPSFWLGLALVWLFSVRLGWLPVSQMRDLDAASLGFMARLGDLLRHLTLPCLALTLPSAAGIALLVREEMRASLGRGFIRAARARGVGRRSILLRHSLSTCLLSLVTLLGLALPGLLAGSAVLEVLFAWPGVGRLAYQAVLGRDGPLVLGCTWAGALMVVGGSLMADLLAALVDPRVKENLP